LGRWAGCAEKLPLVAMVAASCVVTVMAQKQAMSNLEQVAAGDANTGDVVGVRVLPVEVRVADGAGARCIRWRLLGELDGTGDRGMGACGVGDGGSGIVAAVADLAAALAAYAVALLPVIGWCRWGRRGRRTGTRTCRRCDLSGGRGRVRRGCGGGRGKRRGVAAGRRGSAPGERGWRAGPGGRGGGRGGRAGAGDTGADSDLE